MVVGFLTGLIRGQYQVEITSDKFLKDASVNFGINKAGPNIPIKCKIPYTNMSLVVKPTLSISQDEKVSYLLHFNKVIKFAFIS